MTDAAKEARREYRRQWAKNNPDKVRAMQERYWEKQAEHKKDGSPAEPERKEAAAV